MNLPQNNFSNINNPDFFINCSNQNKHFSRTREEIKNINQEIHRQLSGVIVDLSSYERESSGMLCAYSLNHANLRDKPQKNPEYSDKSAFFDRLQLCTINPAEPLLILNKASENNWFFVQSKYARGWIEASHVEIAESLDEWHNYCNNQKRRYILGDCELSISGTKRYFQMGAQLRTNEHCEILFPKNGRIHSHHIFPEPCLTSKLPKFCSDSIIRQAFRYYLAPYSWGGSNGIDCSGLVANVYRSLGISLPQNSWEQSRCPFNKQTFTGLAEENLALLQEIPLGALLWFKGHVMLFLGFYSDVPYVIHALSRYRDSQTGELIWNKSVIVSDLSIQRENGTSLLKALEYAYWP